MYEIVQRLGTMTRRGPSFPKFIARNSTTTPDKVLTNKDFYYNLHLKQGPATSSDHLAIITTISANPIQVPIKTRYSFKPANWENYKKDLTSLKPPILNNKGKKEIDEATDLLYKEIINSRDKHIPAIHHRTIPGAKETNNIKRLKSILQQQINRINNRTCNPANRRNYTETLITLRQEYEKENNNNWTKLIEKAQKTKDPKEFLKSIKRMTGTDHRETQQAIRNENGIVLEGEGIIKGFTKKFKNTFRIPEEDSQQFDHKNEIRVQQYMQENHQRITINNKIDANCGHRNDLDARFHTNKITKQIKSTINKASGISGINKILLENSPKNIIYDLKEMFNAS